MSSGKKLEVTNYMNRLSSLLDREVEEFRKQEEEEYKSLDERCQKYKDQLHKKYLKLITKIGDPSLDHSGKIFYVSDREPLSKDDIDVLCKLYRVAYIKNTSERCSQDVYGDTGIAHYCVFGPTIESEITQLEKELENAKRKLEETNSILEEKKKKARIV